VGTGLSIRSPILPPQRALDHVGNFRTQSFIDAILEIGSDRIMFSTDWPFENVEHAAKWFDAAAISENDRFKIGRVNAAKLLKLDLHS
jgi:2,3-dihydroxybenzoate decarboxylase